MNDPNYDLPSPRTDLFGAHRPSTNPRLHALAKPYSRPASYHDALAGPSSPSGEGMNGSTSPTKSSKQLPSTRPTIPKSYSSTSLGLGMTRSTSETGLLSGIKSILSRPLAWLATPSKSHQQHAYSTQQGQKRDGGWDEEEPGTPTQDIRGSKRVRRRSPTPPPRGDYAPDLHSITGRAITATMLPALPASISLKPKPKSIGPPPNFSRPLRPSQSMPYLDPPTDVLSPVKKRSTLSRSKRVDLSGIATDAEDAEMEVEKKDQWSPWKESHPGRTRASLTPARYTPLRNGESADFGYAAGSPFRVPASPLAGRQTSGLSRAATTSRIRRSSVAASDISMDRESARGVARSAIANGDHDESISQDGNKREGSVLDWFMRDAWQGGSPSARAASARLGSAAPSSSMPPIRKGPLVFDSDKGFVRENDLRSEAPQEVPKNEAERILFALESMRKTPLTEARNSTSSFGSLPPELVGSSSRSIRKAISVPLATAQAGDSARSRREKDRLGEGFNAAISPYGRRRVVERAESERRRERARSELDDSYRPSRTPTRSIDAQSDASSRVSSGMRSEASPSPSPAPTPRRSTRNKRKEDPIEEPTPRARKTRSKAEPEFTKPKERSGRRNTRRTTVERSHSPPPPTQIKEAPPPVPTITETAPSPKQSHTSSSSTYQVREDSGPREKSSLRAKSESKRQHQSAANSRATSPSGGRYSAREEDLPPMEELETGKIQMPSFTGISFAPLSPVSKPQPPATTPISLQTPATTSAPTTAVTKSTLAVPTGRAGPLSRLSSSRPRASSPLASGSIVAEPESPPEVPTTQPGVPAPAPDASGFFSLSGTSTPTTSTSAPPSLFTNIPSDMRTDGPKKAASFGLGKPSGEPKSGVSTPRPNFFQTANADSGTATPVKTPSAPTFNFGLPKDSGAPDKQAAIPALSFGSKSSEPVKAGASVFGGTPVVIPPTPTQTPSPATPAVSAAPTNGFTFGKPAKRAAEETPLDEPAKKSPVPAIDATTAENKQPAFSFGAPTETPSLETPKTGFSFGAPAETPSINQPKSGFTFGQQSSSNATNGNEAAGAAAKPSFSFGQPAAATDAASAKATGKTVSFAPPASIPPPDTASNGFSFGQPSTQTAATKPFSFGAPSAEPSAATPAAPPKSFSFGAPANAPPAGSNLFGSSTPAANAAKTPDASVPGSDPIGSFNFSKPADAAKPSETKTTAPASGGFTFGASQPSTGFKFGQTDTTQTNGSSATGSSGFGSTPAASAPVTTPSFAFGAAAPSTSTSASPASFSFGATAPTGGFGSSAGGSSGGFGSGFGSSGNAPASQPSGQPPAFTFGAPAPAQSGFGGQAATGGFGAVAPSTPTANTSGGGFGSNPGFAFGQPAQTPGANASPFQFGGQGNNMSSTPATAPPSTPSFNFGSANSSGQPFQFGAGAQAQPATPGGGGAFVFGAGAPAGQAPRFGSPQPAAPAADGGFSMGMADPQAPGSPGGRRQIKPLRRTKR